MCVCASQYGAQPGSVERGRHLCADDTEADMVGPPRSLVQCIDFSLGFDCVDVACCTFLVYSCVWTTPRS